MQFFFFTDWILGSFTAENGSLEMSKILAALLPGGEGGEDGEGGQNEAEIIVLAW